MIGDLPRWSDVRFEEPVWLWWGGVAGLLLVVWLWRVVERQRDRRAYLRRGVRIGLAGDLFVWLFLLIAALGTIGALARPVAVVSSVRQAGIDLVILQDASASMRVRDVRGDRWRRSMRFLRVLGESLRWEEDRVALALFANIATPQIRLTRDPNTFFFYLDALGDEPPFRLQDGGTWDTNIERGIYWGLRLVEKDRELLGASTNAQAFLLLSDGQAWSGEVERSLALARRQDVPVYVVGVGTTAGGVIPEPARAANDAPVASRLDRASLAAVATAAGGQYFELDAAEDRTIANAIVAASRRRAADTRVAERTEELYPQCLVFTAALLLTAAVSRLV